MELKRPGSESSGPFACVPSKFDSLEVKVLCAGINRYEVENARVSRERISDLLGPEHRVADPRILRLITFIRRSAYDSASSA
jgi:hypothetical protein